MTEHARAVVLGSPLHQRITIGTLSNAKVSAATAQGRRHKSAGGCGRISDRTAFEREVKPRDLNLMTIVKISA
jgi:hypothetical protein